MHGPTVSCNAGVYGSVYSRRCPFMNLENSYDTVNQQYVAYDKRHASFCWPSLLLRRVRGGDRYLMWLGETVKRGQLLRPRCRYLVNGLRGECGNLRLCNLTWHDYPSLVEGEVLAYYSYYYTSL